MKRVLTFATTGLFLTGLALLPLSARAEDAATGKSVTPAPTASTMTPAKAPVAGGVQTSTAPVKKDDGKVTATPGSTVAKTPAKGAS
jgi:hypothetical protein